MARFRPTRDSVTATSMTSDKDNEIRKPVVTGINKWLKEARRYAKHVYDFEELVDEHLDEAMIAVNSGEDPFDFVDEIGTRSKLTRRI